MEAKEVLRYFIDRCNDRDDYFQCNLASNSVLDWFGRTFRGSRKIEQYLRYDVWPQYEQNFPTAIVCESIETKPTHMQTKETPIENTQLCGPPIVPSPKNFDSPPHPIRDVDEPPPLTRGKRFIKTKDAELSQIPNDNTIETDTKCYNLRPLTTDSTESKDVILNSPRRQRNEVRTLRKRIAEGSNAAVRPPSPNNKRAKQTPSPDYQTIDSACAIDGNKSTTTEPCSTANESNIAGCSAAVKPYSELKYLESIGSIRTIRRVKHPGINKVPSAKTDVVTPFISPESQNGWDRKTKLKLSYRIGALNKNDIQFALIIYEPLTMVTRRNLMEEFQRAALEDEAAARGSTRIMVKSTVAVAKTTERGRINCAGAKSSLSVRTKPKNDKLASLRRLRF